MLQQPNFSRRQLLVSSTSSLPVNTRRAMLNVEHLEIEEFIRPAEIETILEQAAATPDAEIEAILEKASRFAGLSHLEDGRQAPASSFSGGP